MSKSRKFWAITAASCGGLCLAACAVCAGLIVLSQLGDVEMDLKSKLMEGQAAPDFVAVTLGGRAFKLSELRGTPVVLDFSTTWCPNCQVEAPQLQKVAKKYTSVAVVLVDSEEDVQLVNAFAAKNGLTFTIALDTDGSIANRYYIYAIPSLFFIDSNGIILKRFVGALDQAQMDQALAEIGVK
jgi:peroxiredoxin